MNHFFPFLPSERFNYLSHLSIPFPSPYRLLLLHVWPPPLRAHSISVCICWTHLLVPHFLWCSKPHMRKRNTYARKAKERHEKETGGQQLVIIKRVTILVWRCWKKASSQNRSLDQIIWCLISVYLSTMHVFVQQQTAANSNSSNMNHWIEKCTCKNVLCSIGLPEDGDDGLPPSFSQSPPPSFPPSTSLSPFPSVQ